MNEIEEKFYKTFGIEPCKRGFTLKDCSDRDCSECGYFTAKITDRILLELIVLYSLEYRDVKQLKEYILLEMIKWFEEDNVNVDSFKHQVQSLFTEGEENE